MVDVSSVGNFKQLQEIANADGSDRADILKLRNDIVYFLAREMVDNGQATNETIELMPKKYSLLDPSGHKTSEEMQKIFEDTVSLAHAKRALFLIKEFKILSSPNVIISVGIKFK